ncbi:periplasmic heavy metal sensor [Desulfatitalea alkaliphila]|uniref:Periplasmic heavy metal sensor n=1 Tax=Desulfatitalea alkaliphila TaxID=2929485 RepID=A0AA41R5N3_9BACT|nr:periplasmic heavy metal sensor [Desulfatitalea alkaliphila]MCJ8501888.1 periplasmic heavy metal sensor [Desulfatitalea alkaliphila]
MFKRLCALTMVLAMVLGVAGTVPAQDSARGLWWRSADTAAALALTDKEIQQLDRAFEKARLKMIDAKSRVEAEQAKLQALLERRDLDEAAVNAQHKQLEQARTALANDRLAFLMEVRKIIGHDRFQKLKEMREASPRKRPRR